MKDLYIEEYDRLVSLYVEQGMTETDARALAEDEAYDAACDLIADKADNARDAAKDRDI